MEKASNNNGAYLCAILVPAIGFIIGIIQLGTGNPYGGKTMLVSFLTMVISFIIIMGFIGAAASA